MRQTIKMMVKVIKMVTNTIKMMLPGGLPRKGPGDPLGEEHRAPLKTNFKIVGFIPLTKSPKVWGQSKKTHLKCQKKVGPWNLFIW